jgi:hypothetical protein
MQDLLNDIVVKDGIFCGGFVRDYLIRGEPFNDLDFYFPGEWPEPYSSWRLIRSLKNRETCENIIEGMKCHCVRLEALDLSCNVFSFDGEKLFPRTFYSPINYLEAWNLIFKKQFVTQVPGIKNIKLRAKLQKRGWEQAGIVYLNEEKEIPPAIGPWTNFVEAKKRFDRLAGR